MKDYREYILALRKCADEHANDIVSLGHIRVSDLCRATAKLLEALEQEPCEMTTEEYRQRMIKAFQSTNCGELIALCVLPTEKEFEYLEWLLKNHYKKEPCEDAVSKASVFEILGNLMSITYDFDRQITEKDVSKSMDEIKALPPVISTCKKATWIGDKSYPICSKCNCNIMEEYVSYSDYAEIYKPMKYCPNCGTEMESEE